MSENIHNPVLLDEVVENLVTNENGIYIDGTIGFAGHSMKILSKLSNKGRLIGIDLDPYALKHSKSNLSQFPDKSYSLYKGNFRDFPIFLNKLGIKKVDGLVVDLGISSYQINSGHRGFSYMFDGDLDMRFNNEDGLTAKELLNTASEQDISNIIKKYGEEKKYKKIASNIVKYVKSGEMNTTYDLKEAIKKSVFRSDKVNKIFSRVFQAIRISINDEISNLEILLKNSIKYIKTGGRIAVISFHSIEDRIVKNFFRENSITCICPVFFPICKCNNVPKLKLINKRPIICSQEEIMHNIRARSAKLRIAEHL